MKTLFRLLPLGVFFTLAACNNDKKNDPTPQQPPASATYTITFDSQGGSTIPPSIVKSGEAPAAPTPPRRGGYNFAGWYTDTASNNAFNFNEAITASSKLYAKWTTQTVYTITFDSQGGSAVTDAVIESGKIATPPTPPTTRVGHTFDGWYRDAEGNDLFPFATPITGDLMLYARWNPRLYEVAFNINYNAADGSVYYLTAIRYGRTVSEPFPAPTRAEYNFAGWYTDPAGSNAFSFNEVITAKVTLYAKWATRSYPCGNV